MCWTVRPHVQAPAPRTLFENREFGNKLEPRQGHPKSNGWCPVRRGNKEEVLEERGKGGREYLRGREGPGRHHQGLGVRLGTGSSRSPRKSQPCQHLDLGVPASRETVSLLLIRPRVQPRGQVQRACANKRKVWGGVAPLPGPRSAPQGALQPDSDTPRKSWPWPWAGGRLPPYT